MKGKRAVIVLVGMLRARLVASRLMIVIVWMASRRIVIMGVVASQSMAVPMPANAMVAMRTMVMQQAIGRGGQQVSCNRDCGRKPADEHDRVRKTEKLPPCRYSYWTVAGQAAVSQRTKR
jgi:hypothetical protein